MHRPRKTAFLERERVGQNACCPHSIACALDFSVVRMYLNINSKWCNGDALMLVQDFTKTYYKRIGNLIHIAKLVETFWYSITKSNTHASKNVSTSCALPFCLYKRWILSKGLIMPRGVTKLHSVSRTQVPRGRARVKVGVHAYQMWGGDLAQTQSPSVPRLPSCR